LLVAVVVINAQHQVVLVDQVVEVMQFQLHQVVVTLQVQMEQLIRVVAQVLLMVSVLQVLPLMVE
jgi:hypothetical protein